MHDILNRYYNLLFLIVVVFYNLFPKKIRPIALLIFSWLFFALLSKYLLIFLLLTITTIYISAIIISKIDNKKKEVLKETKEEDKKEIKNKYKNKKKLVLILCLLINVSFLFVFKYLKFFTINTNYILNLFNVGYEFSIIKLISPIGISFYTLQALSYLFDCYSGKIEADKNYIRVALFMSFFPSIMEGPIARYSDTAKDLYKGEKITYDSLCYGLQRVLWGLFKKIIIADRLNILVGDILDLSKLQSKTYELNIEEFDLNDLIKEIIRRYYILIDNEGYEFVYENDKAIMVKADKKRMEQVIYNLVNNAVNYTGDDKKIYINLTEKKKTVLVEIKDTGKGIDEKDIKYIWDKYYHNEKKHKRNAFGTGLGLSIVKTILETHGYKYGVKSKLGEGTTFYFEISKSK